MAVDDVPAFFVKLRGMLGISGLALRFTILTAARTGEVIGARWNEFDLDKAIWRIPATRMKAGREHRVPLSFAALAVLNELRPTAQSEFVFPGLKPGRPLSNMAMDKTLRDAKLDITVHGFRWSFKDWATERTNFPHELSEVALAHIVRDKTEAAYRRGDLVDKRRALMDAWSEFCGVHKNVN